MSADIILLARYGPLGASSRVRSYQYLPSLEAAGFRIARCAMFSDRYVAARHRAHGATLATLIAGYARRAVQLMSLHGAAALWIEYELLPWLPFGFERMFYGGGRPVVVDYDDAVFHRYGLHPSAFVRRHLGDKIDRVMRAATVVVAGNEYLAQHARDAGAAQVEIVPSVVDLARYRQKSAFAMDTFTVGWIGSPSTTQYLRAVAPALRAVRDIPGLSVENVGGARWSPEGIDVRNRRWTEDSEVESLLRFDVGIMPLEDDAWARGKCGYKLIQYMGCGLPVIASPVGANLRIVEQGRTGFLASTPDEWAAALRALAASPDLRAAMGRAGLEKARREYALAVTAPRLVSLFGDLIHGKRRARAPAPTGPSLIGHMRSRFAPAFWSAIANLLPRAALLLAGIYVARRFGADAFARFSLAAVTITVAGVMFATALTSIGSKHVPELGAAPGARLGAGFSSLLAFGMLLACVLGAAVLAFAPFSSAVFGSELPMSDTLRIAAAVVVPVVIYGATNGLILGSARFATAAYSTLAGGVVFALVLFPLADRWNIGGALAALGLLYAAAALCEGAAIRRQALADLRSTTRAARLALWKSIAGFAAPMVLFIAMVPVVVWLCNALLSHGAEPLASVARFNAAYNLYAVAAFAPNVLAQVEFVHLSRAKARNDVGELGQILRLAILQNALIMLPIAIAGAALAGPLMELFRLDDPDGRTSLRLMLLAAFVASLSNPTGVFFAVVDRIWLATGLHLGWSLLALVVAWLLRDLGAPGVGMAFLAGFVFHVACAVPLALRMSRAAGPTRK